MERLIYRYRLFDCGTVVLPILKCASTSLVKNTRSRPIDPQDGAVVFIRDPIDRLVSYYNHQRCFRGGQVFDTWGRLVNFLLWGPADEHWQPQSEQIADGFEKRMVAFEQIGSIFPWLPRLNPNERVPIDTTYRLNELRAFYADDFKLRTSLHR